MSILVNFITPVFFVVIFLSLFVWIFYTSYWVTKRIYPIIRLTIKYKVLRNKFVESDLEWVINAIDKGMSKDMVKLLLLKEGSKMERVEDILYIYGTVEKEHIKKLKGGEINQWRVTK